jgi:kumamolisin
MAPNAEIHVVFAVSSSVSDLRNALILANTLNVDVISNSWGIDEDTVAQYQLQFFFEDQFTNKKTFYLASSGDAFSVSYPSSSSNVVSIGGTTLDMSGMSRTGEFPWAEADGTCAGKGISSIFKRPQYQAVSNGSPNRMIPDLSLIANTSDEIGVMVVHQGYIYGVAGTSLSCPLFAGMLASGLSIRDTKKPNAKHLTQSDLLTNLYSLIPTNRPFTSLECLGRINETFIGYVSSI